MSLKGKSLTWKVWTVSSSRVTVAFALVGASLMRTGVMKVVAARPVWSAWSTELTVIWRAALVSGFSEVLRYFTARSATWKAVPSRLPLKVTVCPSRLTDAAMPRLLR